MAVHAENKQAYGIRYEALRFHSKQIFIWHVSYVIFKLAVLL